jgi:Tfp pilus assembly protein PilX
MKPITPSQFPGARRRGRRSAGVALIIVLAFVVIITGVILAFFSRSIATRQISDASASQTKADLLAQGAADSIIGDLQQEIVLSSKLTTTSVVGTGVAAGLPATSGSIYMPLTPASMLPQVANGSASGLPPNLLKRSAYNSGNTGFYVGTAGSLGSNGIIPSNAINVSSVTPSLNGRSVSVTRWNSHYLLPLLVSATDSTPVTTGNEAFTPPDWVLVPRSGPPPTAWNSNMVTSATNGTTVIGRYAYAIYHEGGLLDANVVGYPSTTSSNTQSSYKPALAYADLTQLPGGFSQNQQAVDQLVAWRNAASAQPTEGDSFQYPGFTQASGSNYFNYIVNNPNTTGFLQVSGTTLNNAGSPSSTQGQTDRMFGSRQELIGFMQKGLGLTGTNLQVLNYLATFTRGLNQPSIAPDPTRPLITQPYTNGGNNAYQSDSLINPNFLTIRVSGSFTRNNGGFAVVGEPFVKKRFALSKIAWLTYLGPSANRNLYLTFNPGVNNQDYDIWQLEHTYGISPAYLAQGTPANIQKYFGLVWQPDQKSATPQSFHDGENKWFYQDHNASSSGGGGGTPGTANSPNLVGPISRLTNIAALGSNARDPDFFELLKAAVIAGSKAQGDINLTTAESSLGINTHPYIYQTLQDTSLDYAIIQLGANIIDQFKVDGYSTRIVFNDGSDPVHEFRGVENLPYLYRIQSGTIKLRSENPVVSADIVNEPPGLVDPGIGMVTHVPVLWNPHDANAPLGDPAPAGPGVFATLLTGGTSQLVNNNFRLIADSVEPPSIQPPTNTNLINVTYNLFSAAGGDLGNTGGESGPETTQTISATFAKASLYTTGTGGSGTAIAPPLGTTTPTGYALDPNNAEMTFQVPSGSLFREPTIMGMINYPFGSKLQLGGPVPQFALIQNHLGKPAYTSTNGFLSDGANPLNLPSAPPATQGYAGIGVALYPIEWVGNPITGGTAAIHRSDGVLFNTNNGGGAFIDYRLQYKDPNPADTGGTGWETYDEKYTQIATLFLGTPFGTASGNLSDQADGAQGGDWQSYADPRTARFAAVNGKDDTSWVETPAEHGQIQEWADQYYNATGANGPEEVTDRPDINSGYAVSDDRTASNVLLPIELYPLATKNMFIDAGFFRIGMFSQNIPAAIDNGIRYNGDSVSTPGDAGASMYYQDPDGVVRGAMGNYVTINKGPPTTTVGLPLATAYPASGPSGYNFAARTTGTYQGQSRPYILHRPFRSVAELGYVFSGTPWKNIDFFTPQSGDAPLLDLFTANETPDETVNSNQLVAGVVDLNTQQEPVLKALLAGAYVDEAVASGTASTDFTSFDGDHADAILTPSETNTNSLLTRTAPTNTATGQGPLQNISDLVGRWNSALEAGQNLSSGYSGVSADLGGSYQAAYGTTGNDSKTMQNVDRFREAFIRPLAAAGNTRVWNLMIDVIAQTGRYPQSAAGPANFVVDGEQRYWVHVAIDRYTGQVLDKQVEVVKE